jgi:hypothetical protein
VEIDGLAAAADPKPRIARTIWSSASSKRIEPCASRCRLHWVVAPVEGFAAGLRLAHDAAGSTLLPVPEEAFHREAEAARREAESARARIAELEEKLTSARRKKKTKR